MEKTPRRPMDLMNAATILDDLRIPPGNRLEGLKGNYAGFYIVRINDQWRIIFKWLNGDADKVQIIDYH